MYYYFLFVLLFFILNTKLSENPLNLINAIELKYPNFKKGVLDSLQYVKSKSFDYKSTGRNNEGYKYYENLEKEFLGLFNQQPTDLQLTDPPQPQKPLNEGQEILKDIFKSLLK